MHDYILKPLNQIRHSYKFDVSCQGSVPIAIEAFLESETFEQAIRLAISMGGDADTLGAIAGSIAEAYYNVPKSIILNAEAYLPIELRYKLYDLNGLNRIFEEEKLQQRGIIS